MIKLLDIITYTIHFHYKDSEYPVIQYHFNNTINVKVIHMMKLHDIITYTVQLGNNDTDYPLIQYRFNPTIHVKVVYMMKLHVTITCTKYCFIYDFKVKLLFLHDQNRYKNYMLCLRIMFNLTKYRTNMVIKWFEENE